jgi:hypothetical protein
MGIGSGKGVILVFGAIHCKMVPRMEGVPVKVTQAVVLLNNEPLAWQRLQRAEY